MRCRGSSPIEPVGKAVEVVILRDGKELTLTVTLGLLKRGRRSSGHGQEARRHRTTAEPDKGTEPPPAANAGPVVATGPLGIALAELSPETRTEFGIKADVTGGVVVVKVEAAAPAADKRLQAGDVISMVGEELVASPAEFDAQIEKLKKDGRANVKLVVQNKEGHVRWVNLPLEK